MKNEKKKKQRGARRARDISVKLKNIKEVYTHFSQKLSKHILKRRICMIK